MRRTSFNFWSLALCVVGAAIILIAPQIAQAHDGHVHEPEATAITVSAPPGGDHKVFLPVIITQSSDQPADNVGDAHALNDYTLAEAARKRNDPPFQLDPKDIKAAEAPGDLIFLGEWGSVVSWPFVFATAANLPDGRILTWGGNNINSFTGGTSTYATVWDPATNQFLSRNNTQHSMFCSIPTMMEDGRVFTNGGDGTRERTSIFDYRTNTWTRVENMSTGRWYPGSVALPNGKVLTAIGEPGNNYPEVWTEGQGWSLLTGANLQNGMLNQAGYQSDWLPYLFLAPNGKVLHSGPVAQMNWIDPSNSGSIAAAGAGANWYPKYGVSIMYEQGKILVAGGMTSGSNNDATDKAMILDINGATPQKTVIASMAYPRTFNSGVMLPTGEVLVIGGNTNGEEFVDANSILPAEIWNPTSQTWRTVASISVPRNYHSVALLMPDGRVFSGGGGLCNCPADHPDAQIYTPPYLFNADGTLATRPTLSAVPDASVIGRVISVTASTGIQKFSLIKMSATTHDLNSDLRFLNVPFTSAGNGNYQLTLNSNNNVLTPGYWMLFAVNGQGVPSVAKVIQITTSGTPRITNPGSQSIVISATVALNILAFDPDGTTLTYSATGLPPGLSINPSTGVIGGAATAQGIYNSTVNVTDGASEQASTTFVWSVLSSAAGLSYDYYEGTWSVLPNFSALTPAESGVVTNFSLAPRNRDDFYAFRFRGKIAINTPGTYTFYTNSDDGSRLWINGALVVDNDGSHSAQERSGTITLSPGNHILEVGFFDINGNESLIVSYAGPGITKQIIPDTLLSIFTPLAVVNPGPQAGQVGNSVSLLIQATSPATFTASGLPPGASINTSGLIAGTLSTVGTFNATVTATSSDGQTASATFTWSVSAATSLTLNPISSPPKPVNTSVSYAASASNAVNPRFKWLFGDGTPETAYSTSPNIAHSFAQPGLYVIKVTATDDTAVEKNVTFVQAIHLPQTANRSTHSMNIAYEARVTGNSRVWVVNQDNDTVSVFDAVTNAKLTEIAVGNKPRSIAIAPNGNVWVANKGTGNISIINANTLSVAQTVTLPFASQPFGIAFAPTGGSAYVALEASGKLLRLDATSGAQTGSLDVVPNPRGVAVSADGATVLVSRFVTPRLVGEETASVQTGANTGGEVVSINAATMTINQTVVLQHSDAADTENQGRGIPNYLGAAAVSPDGGSAWVPSKQDNIKRGALRDGNSLTFQNSIRAITSRIDLTVNGGSEDLAGRVDHDNSSVGSAALFDSSGSYLFVALETSREVAVIDPYSKQELFRFDVGRAPQGLAIAPDGLRLYVNNFMDRSVGVYDLTTLINTGVRTVPLLTTLNAVTTEQLSAPILVGKQLFYDAKDTRLARDSYISCASCHNDGGQDGRVWDFTGVGEGLRNTVAVNGRAGTGAGGQGFLHWSGNFDEVQDFEGQIRNFAGGTGLMTDAQFNTGTRNTPLGDAKAGVSTDLDALAAYLASLNSFASSPYRNTDGTLTASATAGKTVFQNANCAQCHGGTAFSNSGANTLFNIGTLKPSSGQRLGAPLNGIDPPTLRDVWASGPYLHDGSATSLSDAVSAHNNVTLSAGDLANLVAYLQQIGGQETTAPSLNQAPSASISSPANNATFTAPATILITATASDSDGTISQVQFFNGATLLGTDTTAPYSFSWTGVAVGSYALTARATDNAGASTTSAVVNVTVNASAGCTLPAGYASLDVGYPVLAGSACESGGTWTVKGSGDDIWGPFDHFRFAYRDAVGDYTIIARVTSMQNTDEWAKAGVMFRDGTAGGAKYAMVMQMPNNEVIFQWRSVADANANWNGGRMGGTANLKWLRLVKTGTTFTAYYSTATGTPASNEWTQVGTPQTISMSTPKVGLAVTSHNNGALCTTTFTDVSVTLPSSNQPPSASISSPANNATFTAPATILITATASDSDGTVSQVEFFNGATLLGTDTTAPYAFNWTSVAAGSYALTARATDNAGASTTSTAVNVTVNAPTNQPPSASISSPANNATFTAPATILITATASDSDGTVSQVEFFNGATLLGTDTTAPYAFNWTSVAAGSYALTARATDNAGASTTSTAVNVTVNAPTNQPPSASITSPANNATFTAPATILITATASDSDGTVSQVQFFNGATLLGTDTTAPYAFNWTSVAAGNYALTARATDNAGASTTSVAVNVTVNAPANQPPSASISGPANNATFTAPATILITATASDSDGTVSQVQFFNGATLLGTDTTAPYAFNWTSVVAGSYALTARATDNAGASTTSVAVNVTVNAPANQPPSASITSPANNATFTAPATILITATASDSDGTVSQVQFFNGATLLGTDTTAPYSFSWTGVAVGSYTLTARATDNASASTTSTVVNVTVNASAGCTLPSGYASLDVGYPVLAGSACESGGTWTVKGSGDDIWGPFDHFRFAYRDAVGNYTIIARVTSMQNTDEWAKAGVMFRDGTAGGAKYAMVMQMPNNEVGFQWRKTANANASWNGARVGGTGSVKWVRLVKSGTTFTASYSTATGLPASNQWIQIGSPQTISMSAPKAGLYVTSHNNGLLNTTTFTNVSVSSP